MMTGMPVASEPKSKLGLEQAESQSSQAAEHKLRETFDEDIYLIGRPTLKQFLRFIRNHAIKKESEANLSHEWQAASDVVRRLEKEEAGIADNPVIRKMGREYEPLLIELLKDPLVRNGFNSVPTEVAIVDLDRLVVYQHHIDLTFVRELKRNLGPTPSEEQIFRTCLPYDHPQPPVKWSRTHQNTFVFVSPSNDLRFLGTAPLQPFQIKGYDPSGSLVAAIALEVGFGSNFLNAVQAEKRLILNNGSHRAYALRAMGITHVPCIVQHISSREELDSVVATSVEDEPDYFLKNPRPPMLKDYFDSRLRKVVKIHKCLRQITVKFDIDEANIPAF